MSLHSAPLPKVTVVVITYNQEHLLPAALDSILAQDYPNLDIVLSDDASSDGTAHVAREYARQHPSRFTLLLAEKNGGISVNSNRGLQAATGDIIIFFAGDDIMNPGMVCKHVEALLSHPKASLCHSNLEWFNSDTGETIRLQNQPGTDMTALTSLPKLARANYITGPGVTVRRKCIPAHGFDTQVPTLSDWLFAIETAVNGGIVYVDEVLVRYRIHANNISKRWHVMVRDSIRTLELVSERYPNLQSDAEKGLAFQHRVRGINHLHNGLWLESYQDLSKSIRYKPLNISSWAGSVLALGGLLETKIFGKSRVIHPAISNLKARMSNS